MTITSEQITNLRQLAELCISNDTSVDENMAYANFISRIEPETINFLLAHIDSQAARIAELENDEVRQRMANAEHQLHMKDLTIHNIKASRRAQFRKRMAAEKELAALKDQEPVSVPDHLTYIKELTLKNILADDENSPMAHAARILCAEVKFWRSLPLYRQSVPAAPVAVPDDSINPIRGSKPFVVKLPNCVYDLYSVGPVMSAEDVIRAIKSAGGSVEDE